MILSAAAITIASCPLEGLCRIQSYIGIYKIASSTSTIQGLTQAGALKQGCSWKTAIVTVTALEVYIIAICLLAERS
jgi:hypothetical protein